MKNSSGWEIGYITGGSSGIGFAIADRLCREEASVVLIARNRERLTAAAQSLRERYPGASVETVALDVTDRSAVGEELGKSFDRWGTPDLLVNCAGIAYPDYFEHLPDEQFETSLRVNAGGAWNVLKAAVPVMKSGTWIVNVASVSGFIGTFGYTAYSAGKFALLGLSEALRNELVSRGIGVSVLCPSDTATPQLEQEERTKPPETRAVNGTAKLMQPEQVADELFRGLRKRRFMIVPGSNARLIYYLKRFFPGVVFRVMDRTVQKAAAARREDSIRGVEGHEV